MLTLFAALDRQRFAPSLVVLDGRGPLRPEAADDGFLHDLHRPRVRSALPALLRVLRALRPRVVVSTITSLNMGVLMLKPALLRPLRIVVREANAPAHSLRGMPVPPVSRLARRLLYRAADRVICPSRAIAAEVVGNGLARAERVAVLGNPVDVAHVRAAARRPERQPGEGRRFVAAGRLHRQKGYDRLLEMLAAVPGASHLTLFGDGEEGDALRRLAERLGVADRVCFAGFDPEPWRSFAGADAFLLASRWEGMPNAALEALACGTPVIATPEAGAIGEVATETPPGAVTLAEAGPAFVAAMTAVTPRTLGRPRESLLPAAFERAAVAGRFAALLEE